MNAGANSGMNAEGGANASPSLLGDRYRVICELGQGSLGVTYLAEDLNRGRKPCVVRELASRGLNAQARQTAKALFAQEAGNLCQIKHPQIPEFRELLEVETSRPGSEQLTRLFMVQDYIEGSTYHQLLTSRQSAGIGFSETDITQLLHQLLPVLSHIHQQGITHRDISPDNIVLKQADALPALIDFGSLKEVAAKVRAEVSPVGSGTTFARVGKVGYMPPEQLTTGQVDATSDLYSLAASLLVLANGQDPQTLHDSATGSWTGFDVLSPKLGAVLGKMLEVYPIDRFQNAETVMGVLNNTSSTTRTASKPIEDAAITSGGMANGMTSGIAGGIASGIAGGIAAAGLAGNAANSPSAESNLANKVADSVAVNGNAIYPPVDTPTETPMDAPLETAVIAGAVVADDGFADDVVEQGLYGEAAAIPMAAMGDRPGNRQISSTYETTLAESNVHEPYISDDVVEKRDSRQAILPLLILLGVFGTFLGLAWMRSMFTQRNLTGSQANREQTTLTENVSNLEGAFYSEEVSRRQQIINRREASGIGDNTFTRLVDQLFYGEYPKLLTSGPNGGRKALTSAPEDEPLRIRWDSIALNLLNTFDGNLSQRSLARLGDYSESDRTQWQSQVNQVNVSSRSLYDLTDAKFLSLFPNQGGQDFLKEPIGQLYYAIAEDKAQAIEEGAVREDVTFAAGTFSTDLENSIGPGNGRVYTLALSAGQRLRLNLSTPARESTLLSVYLPNPTDDNPAIIADSEQTTWAGEVSQSGTYEIVVVNQSAKTIGYQLAIGVSNVTTSPPVAPDVEDETENEPQREDLPPIPGDENGDSEETDPADSDETVDS
ncbi:MAG: serine/threonine-protein kinase [Cyanobacteria bacterium J06560_2]